MSIICSLSFSAYAAVRNLNSTYSMTIGHQNTQTIQLLEVKIGSSNTQWEIRFFENGALASGRALTFKTYEKILKDLNKIFPDQKNNEICGEAIMIVKTIQDGLKRENICSSEWSKIKKKKFAKLYRTLKDLSTSKIPIYE